jgi:hypothetical protein
MGKLKSGAKSLFTIAKNAAKGIDQSVPKEVEKTRIDLCNGCDKLTVTRQCSECLCFVDAKTKFKQEECPLKKWTAYKENIQ